MERICRVDECGKPTIGQGLCESHYRRWTRYGVIDPIAPEKGFTNPLIALSPQQHEVLDGELLGDGCLMRRPGPRRNGFLSWCLRSRGHIDLLASIFDCYGPRIRPFGETGRWTLVTLTNPGLTPERDRWYPGGKKQVPPDIALTPTVCLHWFLGDGANRGGGSLRLHTEGFPVPDVEHLAALLRAQGFTCNLRFRRFRDDQRRPFIALGARAGRDFLAYVGACPVADYTHKWRLDWMYG